MVCWKRRRRAPPIPHWPGQVRSDLNTWVRSGDGLLQPPGCRTIHGTPAFCATDGGHGRSGALQSRPEEEWPDPGPEDLYQSGPVYRVCKKKAKRPSKTFDARDFNSPAEAEAAAEARCRELKSTTGGEYSVHVSKGERLRCSTYCPVASKCSTYQDWLKDGQVGLQVAAGCRQGEQRSIADQDVEKGAGDMEALVPGFRA